MATSALITAIVDALGGSIVAIAEKLGAGISAIITNLIYVTVDTTTSLSPFAVVALVLMGISLGFTLFRWGLNFFTSLGRRNR